MNPQGGRDLHIPWSVSLPFLHQITLGLPATWSSPPLPINPNTSLPHLSFLMCPRIHPSCLPPAHSHPPPSFTHPFSFPLPTFILSRTSTYGLCVPFSGYTRLLVPALIPPSLLRLVFIACSSKFIVKNFAQSASDAYSTGLISECTRGIKNIYHTEPL